MAEFNYFLQQKVHRFIGGCQCYIGADLYKGIMGGSNGSDLEINKRINLHTQQQNNFTKTINDSCQ